MMSQKISLEEQEGIIQGMLLSNMLNYLSIPVDQYFRKTSYLVRERHISRCRRCSCLGECVHMLLGEYADPETFCPNYKDFKRLKQI